MVIEYKDIKVIDSHQFPNDVLESWSKYVDTNYSTSNDIYVCFNNELYGDDDKHDEIVDFLIKCGVDGDFVLISRWW